MFRESRKGSITNVSVMRLQRSCQACHQLMGSGPNGPEPQLPAHGSWLWQEAGQEASARPSAPRGENGTY
eukprot:3310469-Alexandrium_andersonii.AAC.1